MLEETLSRSWPWKGIRSHGGPFVELVAIGNDELRMLQLDGSEKAVHQLASSSVTVGAFFTREVRQSRRFMFWSCPITTIGASLRSSAT